MDSETQNIFDELLNIRRKNPRKFLCTYININSLRNKFASIHELLVKNIVDVLFISETKLDDSFRDAQFQVNNYHFCIAAYLRSSIADDGMKLFEFRDIESISLEVNIENKKWLIIGAYKPPCMPNNIFKDNCSTILDKACTKYDNFILMGDLNFDMLDSQKCEPLAEICDIFYACNVVKSPTCFSKIYKPSLLDVIITNKPSSISKTCNFNCGLSDMHNMIAFQLKVELTTKNTNWIKYRSFKHFDVDTFNQDLQSSLSSLNSDPDDVNLLYNNFSNRFLNIVNQHAPIKKKKVFEKPAPFMNQTLKQAIYKKRMLLNNYNRYKNAKNWEKYRKQRNLVNSIKRKSINKYFLDRCTGGCNNKDFWPTVKPFLTNKGTVIQKDTILCENNTLINSQEDIADIFNKYFVNVAKDIGSDSIPVNENHPSLIKISEIRSNSPPLTFAPVCNAFVSKQIDKLSVKKATGHAGISSKLIKLAKPSITDHITTIVNKSLSTSVFPDELKVAQIAPLHKKNSTLEKGNYRPVSLLPVLSKVLERAINTQLTDFFNHHFNTYLSAFRPGYGCQSTLLKVVEDWKQALDENKYVAAILMDLSKAFDCLPHDLLLLKLKYYGIADSALKLLDSYLSNRKQCVKIGQINSSFRLIYKGVPQGSILGPVLFNIFINDIFHFVSKSNLYNYADDNTISFSDMKIENVISTLEKDSKTLIHWFSDNQMKANPDKFQAIAIGKKTKDQNIKFDLEDNEISCEEEVNLLGVTLDFKLKFHSHISKICKKASRQLNVLKRIGKNLCKLGKLNIYHSFIMSNFNYCPLTWHFCGELHTKKIEKIQERALRFIYDDYTSDYDSLLRRSKLPTLKMRRMRTIALETHKILNKQGPLYLHDLVTIKDGNYHFRYRNTAQIPQVRTTTYGSRSFRASAPKLWNSLPQHFRDETNFNHFKSLINAWDGDICSCSACG